jgi:DNA repair protein RadC
MCCSTLLDTRHRLIRSEILFRGTVDGAAVHPREVARVVVDANASAVILFHNHPSGVCEPSSADERITARLTETLALIDVRVLDHLIIGAAAEYSFAEAGRL